LIVPIQVYLGSAVNLFKTLLIVLALPLLIAISLAVLHKLAGLLASLSSRMPWIRNLRALLSQPTARTPGGQHLTANLLEELVIVGWVLILLFWHSQHQGVEDARRDALEVSSTLPVVSLVLPQQDGILSQDLRLLDNSGEPVPDPPLANHVLIGDLDLARSIRATSLSDRNTQQVWRLLANETSGWLYLIRTLPASAPASARPPVLAIPNAKQGQSLILGPALPELSP
jgi:hypothetical protein